MGHRPIFGMIVHPRPASRGGQIWASVGGCDKTTHPVDCPLKSAQRLPMSIRGPFSGPHSGHNLNNHTETDAMKTLKLSGRMRTIPLDARGKAVTQSEQLHLCYRKTSDNEYRVWRSDWSGDQFEVMRQDNFNMVEWVCTRFSIKLEDCTHDED